MTTTAPATCTRCGRALRTDASRAAGVGPVCAKRIRQETVAASFKPEQVEKAREVIDLGAIRLARRGLRVYRVVASDGATRYMATAHGCTCPAGRRHVRCYHVAAVAMKTA